MSLFAEIFSSEYVAPRSMQAMPDVDVTLLPTKIMTLLEHEQIFNNIVNGILVSVDEIRINFERLVRDKEQITLELSKLKKDQLQGKTSRHVRSDDKKEHLIISVYQTMLNSYGFVKEHNKGMISNGYTEGSIVTGNRNRMASLTADDVSQYSAKHLQQRQADIDHHCEVLKAIANPQSLEDFTHYFKVTSLAETPPEVLHRYDMLRTDADLEKRSLKDNTSNLVSIEKVEVDFNLVETKHTRDGHDLFVVQMNKRVTSDEYRSLLDLCRKLGGNYSSFRGVGAVPGFQFKVKSSAESFLNANSGEVIDIGEFKAIRAAFKLDSKTDRLFQIGERVIEDNLSIINQDRKTNTSRRAQMASHIEDHARKELAMGETLVSLANAFENNQVKYLHGLNFKTHLELLLKLLNSAKFIKFQKTKSESDRFENVKDEPISLDDVYYVTIPRYYQDVSVLEELAEKLMFARGFKKHVSSLKKFAKELRANKNYLCSSNVIDDICNELPDGCPFLPWQWAETNEMRKRIIAMGIMSACHLRMACRELIPHIHQKAEADLATELERKLTGYKVGIDFFPTPRHVARAMVAMTDIKAGGKYLEPHGGNGQIAMEIRAAGVEPDVCEISSQLREILVAKKFNLIGHDFLELKDVKFDGIIANPPFSNNQDIIHTRHAYGLLNEKGILTTIVGEGAFSRTGKLETEFREWLEELGASIEKLPEGTFNDSSLMATTGANARIVQITRN